MLKSLSSLFDDIDSAFEAENVKKERRWLFFRENFDIPSGMRGEFNRYIPVRWVENSKEFRDVMIIAWQPSKSRGVNKRGELAGRLGKFLRLISEQGNSLLLKGRLEWKWV